MGQIDQAIAAHRAGNLKEAETLYRDVLKRDGRDFDALHMLGVICAQREQFDEAEQLLRTALSVDQRVPPCFYNYANVLSRLKRYEEAIKVYDRALTLAPNYAPIYSDRGNAQKELGRLAEALESYDRAIALHPNFADAHNNRGIALAKLKRDEDALASYDRALTLNPNYAAAYTNRGEVLSRLKRHQEALASCDRAISLQPGLAQAHCVRGAVLQMLKRYPEALASCDQAIALDPGLALAHINRGAVLTDLKRYPEAVASCDQAISLEPGLAPAHSNRGAALLGLERYSEGLASYDRAIALDPNLAAAHSSRGVVLSKLKRLSQALASCDRALSLDPDLARAYANRGSILLDLRRYPEAVASFDQALALDSDLAFAHGLRGTALMIQGRYDEGFAACDKAFAIDPDLDYVEGNRLHAKQRLCNWDNLTAESSHLLSSLRRVSTDPFGVLAIPSLPADQLACARIHVAKNWPLTHKPLWHGEIYSHDRIRIAYLSSDLREHPVAYQTVGLFEHHDKSRFEVTAISLEGDQNSEFGRRLRAPFERFIDGRLQSEDEIADLIRRLEIDILVDLNGLTQNSRPGILARRPAPIQVNYLGYSGTFGAEYSDYIIADRTVLPAENFVFYSEKVVWLPDSFLATDAARFIAERTPTRSELGLPDHGFVFCSFNQSYKIHPMIFDVWMRLLQNIDGSVLWLKDNDPIATRNLRFEAERRGVASERLVFAPNLPLMAEHLARHRQADLFLDTLPYNAHVTAGDALWAGLPVITCLGSTFAGRVAASLLNAAGLSELITASLEDYEVLALKLARDPSLLASIKHKLASNIKIFPLFNTERFTRHLEAGYVKMWERFQNGEPSASFAVDAIRRP